MASSFESFRDLELNRDEVERLQDALKDKEFRKLLVDYVDEITDPENQKLYQNEIVQLEKERGVDVKFINPVPGYVIKTSIDGTKKCFLNVCSNELVQKPSSVPKSQEGSKGLEWSLPHTITPPREDFDNKKARCQVFDVVFHPDTLHLAKNNKAFRNMVNATACNAVETNFSVVLDQKNLKFPKLNYKGLPHAAVLRKPSSEKPREKTSEEQELLDRIYDSIPKPQPTTNSSLSNSTTRAQKAKSKKNKGIDIDYLNSNYTTPSYVIKHRSHVELEEFTEHRNSKMNSAIPKELVVEVNLPLLKSASDIVLDVAEKTLHLKSEKPAKYKLTLTLPYHVNQDSGNAKFDKDQKKIIVTLPVKRNNILLSETSRDDSGVESDHGSPVREEQDIKSLIEEETGFLNPSLVYNLPDHTCHLYDNILAFTLHVKNVNENSIEKTFSDTMLQIKFTSISSGFYPVHYAIFLKLLAGAQIDAENVSVETWDNNVVLQVPYKPCDYVIKSYLLGLCEKDATEKCIEDLEIIKGSSETSNDCDDSDDAFTESKAILEDSTSASTSDTDASQKEQASKSRAINISSRGAISESSGDELSCSSYSPHKSRGILKRLSRSSVSRSISESSIDDLMWASSFENCHASLDSVIPEDGEVSTSLKKTVRFSNVVSKQVFRFAFTEL